MDIYLDPSTGDIATKSSTPYFVTDEASLVRQRLKIRLNTFQGEWFYNSQVGVPYYQDIFGKRFAKDIIDNVFRRAILDTEGVQELKDYKGTFNPSTRQYEINFTVTTLNGNSVSVNN